jgi:hypothetical protein
MQKNSRVLLFWCPIEPSINLHSPSFPAKAGIHGVYSLLPITFADKSNIKSPYWLKSPRAKKDIHSSLELAGTHLRTGSVQTILSSQGAMDYFFLRDFEKYGNAKS